MQSRVQRLCWWSRIVIWPPDRPLRLRHGERQDRDGGEAKDLIENPDIKEFYLGIAQSGDARAYADVKSYRRRKRWL
jgi:hypothetical protein